MSLTTVPRFFLLLLISSGFKVPIAADDTGKPTGNIEQRAGSIKLFQTFFRTRRLAMRCAEGEYYEKASGSCRSCSTPCQLNEDKCIDLGCADYVKASRPPVTIKDDGNENNTTEAYFTASQGHMLIGIVLVSITVSIIGIGVTVVLIRRVMTLIKDRRKQSIEEADPLQTRPLLGKLINDEETGRTGKSNGSKKGEDDIEEAACESESSTSSRHPVSSYLAQPSGDLDDTRECHYYGMKTLSEPSDKERVQEETPV